MTNPGRESSVTFSRRAFCRSAVAAAALGVVSVPAQASQSTGKVRFYKNLGHGHIGVRADQRQALEYAVKFGFDGITPNPSEFENRSSSEIREWVDTMKSKGVRYGAAGLSAEFRRDQDSFQRGMEKLPKEASILQQLGVTRVATWIMPGHGELTYLQNFEQHKTRLSEAAKVLNDHGLRLGLEFVGPRTSRARNRFPFICAQRDMMELVDAIDAPNVGLLMDSWHWYTSHGTVQELLTLSNRDIVHVHVNDAPAGVPVDQQVDNRRALPAATGVIDMKGFINALVRIGYDGPIECEPFDQQLRQMDAEAALQKTSDALDRVWGLINA
ncbi:MAG: sugar phosphate isomerase/epimerase family protein [Sedimentisphaerales bacterium]|jgi:sugar phosphate isomerase/epimerase|nr:sugar phosphate isomerase/epimerase family protein [Sedimentisphaerales bacterium]HNY78399.1 sugar phosphate isomerase/epimerase family protein [Sedimentisphaerales bacterium]HOC63600.1 sugar phosphate isomerase/epimerase family protein [Sedimentisphaerales bacterium]HOH64462.1 sugar phosphate isomerase/epimerase family protein [Sedimentisphaerales bacterium]HPY51854.1 sugar phosphate isomerase/epimerase family protein [Sedimentisphaerales bacterium]